MGDATFTTEGLYYYQSLYCTNIGEIICTIARKGVSASAISAFPRSGQEASKNICACFFGKAVAQTFFFKHRAF